MKTALKAGNTRYSQIEMEEKRIDRYIDIYSSFHRVMFGMRMKKYCKGVEGND